MPDVYVSRYVNMTSADVLDALQLHRPTGDGLVAHLGPPTSHDGMALAPVTWSCGEVDVLDGSLRISTVADGDPPVTEVLLVGYRDTAGANPSTRLP